jgi:hypothetical protein
MTIQFSLTFLCHQIRNEVGALWIPLIQEGSESPSNHTSHMPPGVWVKSDADWCGTLVPHPQNPACSEDLRWDGAGRDGFANLTTRDMNDHGHPCGSISWEVCGRALCGNTRARSRLLVNFQVGLGSTASQMVMESEQCHEATPTSFSSADRSGCTCRGQRPFEK